uniref:GOLD domain-containing protein n=1 Tax=Haemonchus placei TaxID=6290 RepID=A0A0N4X2J4_HAEPC
LLTCSASYNTNHWTMSWNNGAMMCDVMPTISEDGVDNAPTTDGPAHDANIEQLMVNMLEDRDKLQEQVEHYKHQMEDNNRRVRDLEKEKESLRRQFEMHTQNLPNVGPWLFIFGCLALKALLINNEKRRARRLA